MRARVFVSLSFMTDIPVEDDNAGWQAADKGGRMLEQQLIWEETMPQLLKHGVRAEDISAQVSISELPPGTVARPSGPRPIQGNRGMHVPAAETGPIKF